MPRTKYVRSSKVRSKFSSTVTTKQEPPESSESPESRESMEDFSTMLLSQFEKDVATARLNHENRIAMIVEQIDQIAYHEYVSNLSLAKKTLGELKAEKSFSVSSMKSMMFETASLLKHLNCTSNTTFTATKTKKQTDDEGYLTAGEIRDSDRRNTRARSSSASRRCREPVRVGHKRASRSLSRSQMAAKNVTLQVPEGHKRASRSLSRSQMAAKNVPEKKLMTPQNKMKPPTAFGMVTPKMKPNMPVSILRRPQQGEMAISMQGSPLLVSGVVTESCANVNIPLTDGRILSLQPSRALRMSEIPHLDEETRQQLAQLRDNLNKVVKLTYDK